MTTKDYDSSTTFNLIAESWYRLRHWTRFKRELDNLATRWGSGRLLNIGCAHGADFLPFGNAFDLYGLDLSVRMMEMAIRYSAKFNLTLRLIVGDAVYLPFVSGSFDWAIAVAVYHHIHTEDDRLKAVKELKRVLKRGGEAFITVWNHWQRDFIFRGKQVIVPWRAKSRDLPRYHYLYNYCELEKLLRGQGFEIIKSYPETSYKLPVKYFSRNVCILARSR